MIKTQNNFWQVGWCCLTPLQRVKTPLPMSVMDMTLNNPMVEVPVMLELWGMRSTLLFPLLPGLFWPGIVAPDKSLSVGCIELTCRLMPNGFVLIRTVWLNLVAWNGDVFDNLTFKLRAYAKLNSLKWNCFWHWNSTYTKLNCLI